MSEARGCDVRVVLGAHCQNDAALVQVLDVALPVLEGFSGRGGSAELDAFHAVVADDAAPERVVEVEHQHLLGAGVRGAPGGLEWREVIGQPALVVVQLGGIVEFRGGKAACAGLRRQRFHIDPGDQAVAGFQQFVVQAAYLVGRRCWGQPLGHSTEPLGRRHRQMLNDFSTGGSQLAPDAAEQPDFRCQHFIHVGFGAADGHGSHEVAPMRRDHHQVRLECVQGRPGVKYLLHIRPERRLVHHRKHALPQHAARHRSLEIVDGRGAQDGDALGGRAGRQRLPIGLFDPVAGLEDGGERGGFAPEPLPQVGQERCRGRGAVEHTVSPFERFDAPL